MSSRTWDQKAARRLQKEFAGSSYQALLMRLRARSEPPKEAEEAVRKILQAENALGDKKLAGPKG